MKMPALSLNTDAIVEFLLRHGEKFIVAGLALGAGWLAWTGINAVRLETVPPNQLPSAIQAAAAQAESHIASAADVPADLVPPHASLTATLDGWRNIEPKEARDLAVLDKPLFENLARRTQPRALPLEDLRAVAGIAVLEVKPPAGGPAPAAAGAGRRPRGRPPESADIQPEPEPVAEPIGQPGRVVPYVVVTGLIPAAAQQEEFNRRFADVGFRDPKLDAAVWTGFEVERATAAAGNESSWQKLDQASVLKLRIAQWAAADPNRVPAAFQLAAEQDGRDRNATPFGFCGPLPTRIDEPWGLEQFHPLVTASLRQARTVSRPANQPAAEQPAALPAFVDRGDGPPGFNPATQPPKPSAGESTPGSQEPQTGPRRMFRFIDTSVEPGKSYRYRVTLKIANPNVGIESQYLAEPALATDLQLAAPPSDATPAVRIPDPVMMLATRLDADDVRRLKLKPGMFELLVMAPSQKTGNYSLRSVVTETGGIANVDESLNRPGDLRFKGEKTTTNRVLLDVFGQQGELVAASPARGGRQTTQRSAGPAEPLEMIFRKPNGSLEIASAADSESRFARYRDTLYPADDASPEDDPGSGPGGPPLEGVPFNPFQTQPRR